MSDMPHMPVTLQLSLSKLKLEKGIFLKCNTTCREMKRDVGDAEKLMVFTTSLLRSPICPLNSTCRDLKPFGGSLLECTVQIINPVFSSSGRRTQTFYLSRSRNTTCVCYCVIIEWI